MVLPALTQWLQRQNPENVILPIANPEAYLQALENENRQLRITGLTTKRAEPYFFVIDKIYISLSTLASQDSTPKGTIHNPA